jgi:hypothetical protein
MPKDCGAQVEVQSPGEVWKCGLRLWTRASRPPRRKGPSSCNGVAKQKAIGPRRRDCPFHSSSSGRSFDRASCRPQPRYHVGDMVHEPRGERGMRWLKFANGYSGNDCRLRNEPNKPSIFSSAGKQGTSLAVTASVAKTFRARCRSRWRNQGWTPAYKGIASRAAFL